MYPVKLGFKNAANKIDALTANEHHVEALIANVFTIEKTLHRTLRQLIVSTGFSSEISDKINDQVRGSTK